MNTTLPTFLTRDGERFTLTFSASAAEQQMLCPAKFSWSRITGIEAAAPRAGMNYGKGIHILLENYYRGAGGDPVALLTKHFADNPQPDTMASGKPEWRTLARAQQAFEAYRAAYPAEDFEVLGVEEPFEVELGTFSPNETPLTGDGPVPAIAYPPSLTVTVKFRGIRDLRVRWHDALWVLDHKTSTEWSDLVVDEGKASFQFMGYAWVERLLYQLSFGARQTLGDPLPADERGPLLPVGGVIGNYIISRATYSEGYKPRANSLPRDQFERQSYPYSDAQLDEWHSRAMGIAREIFACWQAGEWPQRSTACAHWGRCEYYKLCWETDPAYREAAALSADYRPRTPSPFEDADAGKRD